MLTEQSAAYVDSQAVTERSAEIGFCELDVKHVSESYCLNVCESKVCYHYPFNKKTKAKTVNDRSYEQRSGKDYHHPLPNARMTPSERRENYMRLRYACGFSPAMARKMRDWWLG